MFLYYGFDNVKKVGLLTFLLMQSMYVQAQASDVAAQGASGEQQRTYYFPRWPEHRKIHNERIPPPPPGPYMSSALSGSSVNGPSFAADDKPAIKLKSFGSPVQAFSPDIPWHSNSKSPDRWKPENGYHYVEPPVKKQPYPDMSYNMPANYNYGYSAPVMNWPGVARSNSYAPVYTPNNRPQNGGYVRRRPAMNHSAMQSRQPAKRTSYPATGKP